MELTLQSSSKIVLRTFHSKLSNSHKIILITSLENLSKKVKAAFNFAENVVAPLVMEEFGRESVEAEEPYQNQDSEIPIEDAVPNSQLERILICDECGQEEILPNISHRAPHGSV